MGSTGGFADGTDNDGKPWIASHADAGIYHPPYSCRQPRPTVTFTGGAHGVVELAYDAEATAEVVGYGVSGCRIVLMKAGAVTHGLNIDQRAVLLRTTSRTHPTPDTGGRQSGPP